MKKSTKMNTYFVIRRGHGFFTPKIVATLIAVNRRKALKDFEERFNFTNYYLTEVIHKEIGK